MLRGLWGSGFQSSSLPLALKMSRLARTSIEQIPWDCFCRRLTSFAITLRTFMIPANGILVRYVGEELISGIAYARLFANIVIILFTSLLPLQIWSKYVPELADMAKPQHRQDAVWCLNDMITDALAHIPDVFTYLSRLHNQSIFNFCAIPQVCACLHVFLSYMVSHVFNGN